MTNKILILSLLLAIVLSTALFVGCVKDGKEESFNLSDKYPMLSQPPQKVSVCLTNYSDGGKAKKFDIIEDNEKLGLLGILNQTNCSIASEPYGTLPPGVGIYFDLVYSDVILKFNDYMLEYNGTKYLLNTSFLIREYIMNLALLRED